MLIVAELVQRRERRVDPNVIRMMVLSVLLLVVAAVTWGGLSGQPSWTELKSLSEAKAPIASTAPSTAGADAGPVIAPPAEETPGVSSASGPRLTDQQAALVVARERMIGASAVLMLATGALAMLWGVGELASAGVEPTMETAMRVFTATSFAVLSGLAFYQVVLFIDYALLGFTKLHFDARWEYGLAVAVLILAVAAARLTAFLRFLKRFETSLARWLKCKEDLLPVGLAALTGAIATVAYIATPDNAATSIADSAASVRDLVSLWLSVFGALALLLFILVSVARLSRGD
jgi:hypothetical protein